MAVPENGNAKQKARGRRRGCGIALLIVAVLVVLLAVGGAIACSALSKEHDEARSLPLNAVDFDKLKDDGVFHGVYEGGIYGWRYNECDVTVKSGRVTGIQLAGSKDPGGGNTDYAMLYARVIEAQSLQVDTISGATLTSKAYLQCVENALLQAQ
jgi:uncharacterized protein with FMN-binding domain